jgi:hypothetical protein
MANQRLTPAASQRPGNLSRSPFVSLFEEAPLLRTCLPAASLCSSTIQPHPCVGLNDLHPTMDDIKVIMGQKARKLPRVAFDTVHNSGQQAKVARPDTLVQKQTGDGSLGVGGNT